MNPAVHSSTTSAFDLPDHLAAKAAPELVAQDEQHFADVVRSLERSTADLTRRLAEARRAPARSGQEALDRDQEIHRLTSRLRVLARFGRDLCLGRVTASDGSDPVYVGRIGLTDEVGRRLLVDWRSPAAEPFFGATHANPMGVLVRRRYRWVGGRVRDYWDEVLTAEGLPAHGTAAALDQQSAFLASLGTSRSARMRDVLGTIAADQDAVVRAGSAGTLVVDGGPGTGKTVVALHRTAYLLHADPRLGHRRGGVLFIGPHEHYLAYVADVLPSLGEEGVATCTLRDLVPEGASATEEPDHQAAQLKSSAALVGAIERAVGFYERPPTSATVVETPWADVRLRPEDWAEAFAAPDPGTPHNDARDEVWDALVEIAVDAHAALVDDAPADLVRRTIERDPGLRRDLGRAWPVLEAADLVGDLWTVPAYLRLCAPWLDPEEVARLQRADPRAWTVADLPFLDAARQRLGDPQASVRRRRLRATVAAERERMDAVVDHLVETDDSEMLLMSMLRGQDLRDALIDDAVVPAPDPDLLAGPFAHVVVDEAQELTDAEWQMVLARCPSRSLTVVGDRAQARRGFAETWRDRLERVGLTHVEVATLSLGYRTPQEVMDEAEPVIRSVLPDANVPTSVRSTGLPVIRGTGTDLARLVEEWLAEHATGTVCVIGALGYEPTSPRVRSLTSRLAKGLEFDLVVLVEPPAARASGAPGDPVEAAVDRYVAMTRATQQLVLLT